MDVHDVSGQARVLSSSILRLFQEQAMLSPSSFLSAAASRRSFSEAYVPLLEGMRARSDHLSLRWCESFEPLFRPSCDIQLSNPAILIFNVAMHMCTM